MAAFLMAAQLDDIEFGDGLFRVKATNRSMPLQEVAKAFYRPMGIPRELGVGLDGNGSYASEPGNFPNGCHACEVEIDPSTGQVAVFDEASCNARPDHTSASSQSRYQTVPPIRSFRQRASRPNMACETAS